MIRSNKGFSLVELMVVVAIIGILSAIAIPNFQKFQRKSRQSEAKTLLGGIYSAEKAFHTEWNRYVSDIDTVGYIPSGQLRYNAGFAAAGGSTIALINGYTGAPASGFFNTAAVCGSALYNLQCSDLSTANAITTSTAPPNAVGNAATFVAAAETVDDTISRDGAVEDQWSMNQLGQLLNTQSGI